MKVLLDTHIFIWWDSEPEKLSPNILSLLQRTDTKLDVSVVSLWEIQIKSQLGKLTLSQSLEDIYDSQSKNGISFLSVIPAHVLNLNTLPLHHKDPFDRMLISQALVEGLTLISIDQIFKLYDVPLFSGDFGII
ncbi:type II toxin-antitoxin system VapC family toxin [Nostoc sp. ChiQUE01b]|uniref:type II toxin-antitoxin system VapC family toxin n=1 Tax=Nostoc sp. ChiQUE01b TaxID=3075376 RepID=UPI002AD44D84|nr:type II toxin-antitoxin system VapC family toxin [Nostoc sp. ChiQUE01b]MDZ8259773.1 type II toxin-antitoxin system VapC family toxin [Nostoc sp. ChiQUE01b]